MSRRILLVLHEATRTGAPVVAASLVDALQSRFAFDVATIVDGPLRTPLGARMWTEQLPGSGYDAVWCNGAASASVLCHLDPAVPVLVFTHEMGEALQALSIDALDALRNRATLVIAVSVPARDDLVALGVPPGRIEILAPPVASPAPVGDAERAGARSACGADESTLLVVACGEAAWRKGPDLFVHVVGRIADQLGEDVRFAWIGRRSRSVAAVVDHDAAVLGITDRVQWLGEAADASPYLAAADLVLLTSREDPHPLIPSEAALLGTPTVGFNAGRWAPSTSSSNDPVRLGNTCDGGEASNVLVAVNYPDVVGLADVAVRMLRSPDDRQRVAREAAKVVQQRQSQAAVARRFGELLDGLCERPSCTDESDESDVE